MQDDGRMERLIVSLIPVRLISRLLKEKLQKEKTLVGRYNISQLTVKTL